MPWKEVEREGCGMWVDNDPASLADAIAEINSMPLAEMGERGRRWMAAEFSWEKCASEMIALYENMRTQKGERRLAAAHQS
jgi:glycosyltransferase involved in cell wall biosynthesis